MARLAIILHGAFQSKSNTTIVPLFLQKCGIEHVFAPNMAGHGDQECLAESNLDLINRLSEDVLGRISSEIPLDTTVFDHVIIVGCSLGSIVGTFIASSLASQSKKVDLIQIEPILWIDQTDSGMQDLTKQVQSVTPSNGTLLEVKKYLCDISLDESSLLRERKHLRLFSTLANTRITLIKGSASQPVNDDIGKIVMSNGVWGVFWKTYG